MTKQDAALLDLITLKGKIALVTGSTGGIGQATARMLAEAGAHVVISSRKQAECERVVAEFKASGLSAEARACHIGRSEDIAAMQQHLNEAHGGLDILVNNAVLSPWRSIDDTDVPLFDKAVEVNLKGNWYISAAAVRLMRPRGGGSIVNVSSIAGWHPERMLSLYSTLKTATIGMSRSFALEYGASGVRVNTVSPGVILTKLADAFEGQAAERMINKTPLGRFGAPEEIARTILFLCSPLSSYMTGADLVVDGGLSVSVI
ncbi:MAG: family NAD(P)-dependent oxidoreductase [Hydrocarboniphaga sp.]|uniref:SDR family NAD(P)-dependent oxidoreductase n=1 Tax=Hydrocarboniphaga sp. TaxID=2033016 RepID=UPI00262E426F|nr:glucose 1-dehydrogenase [Hydrocarboniphaga sp.]MDB5971134.1 family NAD(P)-dependent oxidoreductase [Hydrocarboniphaga sp.]